MDPERLVVLYSKYSPQCQKLLQIYDASTMDYIKMVCIDNSKFRERILNSQTLHVKTVPCVILIYPNGQIEKFEGIKVTDWLIQQISNNLPNKYTEIDTDHQTIVPETTMVPQTMVPQTMVPQTVVQESQNIGITSIEDLGPMIDVSPQQQQTTVRQKSIAEIAAEMASEREKSDQPAHVKMQQNII